VFVFFLIASREKYYRTGVHILWDHLTPVTSKNHVVAVLKKPDNCRKAYIGNYPLLAPHGGGKDGDSRYHLGRKYEKGTVKRYIKKM
jgi:hypothetical protein